MPIKRILMVEVLQGEEKVLREKYATWMTEGTATYLDGVTHGRQSIDVNDLLAVHSKSEFGKWLRGIINRVAAPVQDIEKEPK